MKLPRSTRRKKAPCIEKGNVQIALSLSGEYNGTTNLIQGHAGFPPKNKDEGAASHSVGAILGAGISCTEKSIPTRLSKKVISLLDCKS